MLCDSVLRSSLNQDSNRAKQKTYIKHNKIYESLRHILCKLAKISYIEIAAPANVTIMNGDFTVGQRLCLQVAFEHISILMLPYFIISFIWKSQTISQNTTASRNEIVFCVTISLLRKLARAPRIDSARCSKSTHICINKNPFFKTLVDGDLVMYYMS